MKTLITLLLTFSCFYTANDISMAGLKIHDSKKTLESIKLELIAQDGDMTKYRTENGNDLSITTVKDKIVYMENDWLQDAKGKQPLFSDFVFGETTLKDIRKKFDTNGFTYKNQSVIKTETHLIMFNCFEFDSKSNEVLVTITKLSLDQEVTVEKVATSLKLDALIIAEKSYLDKLWGKEKAYDTNYKKINP